jgi:putative flavoprotein involved in K+ transport
MASYQRDRVPAFARELRSEIMQLRSSDYRNPAQLRAGGVLIVGAGNSGAEIAKDLAGKHDVWLAGRSTGEVPFRLDSVTSKLFTQRFVLRFIFHRLLTVNTPIGRKARPTIMTKGGPLIRLKGKQLTAAGIKRVGRVAGVRDGVPVLDDGSALDVANVVWCAGYHPGFSWIDLPVLGADAEPIHEGGVVPAVPGLYFVGLHFLYSMSSTMIHGVGRDAKRIVAAIATRRG